MFDALNSFFRWISMALLLLFCVVFSLVTNVLDILMAVLSSPPLLVFVLIGSFGVYSPSVSTANIKSLISKSIGNVKDKNTSLSMYASSKSNVQITRGCCTASSCSMSAPLISSTIKSTFKISCAQNVPKIVFFTEKCAQKRLRGNLHEALFFNGREGGIRTHGGSSPHLISSQAPSTTRTPLHALTRHDAL